MCKKKKIAFPVDIITSRRVTDQNFKFPVRIIRSRKISGWAYKLCPTLVVAQTQVIATTSHIRYFNARPHYLRLHMCLSTTWNETFSKTCLKGLHDCFRVAMSLYKVNQISLRFIHSHEVPWSHSNNMFPFILMW